MFIFGSFVVTFILASVAGMWKTYEKAGHAGWKCIIPFYSLYIYHKMAKLSPWLMALTFVPFFNFVYLFYLNYKVSMAFNKSFAFSIGLTFLAPIFYMILGFGDAKYEFDGPTNDNDFHLDKKAA